MSLPKRASFDNKTPSTLSRQNHLSMWPLYILEHELEWSLVAYITHSFTLILSTGKNNRNLISSLLNSFNSQLTPETISINNTILSRLFRFLRV